MKQMQWCHAAAAKKGRLCEQSQLFATVTSCCADNDIISLRWQAAGFIFFIFDRKHTNCLSHTHTHSQPNVPYC